MEYTSDKTVTSERAVTHCTLIAMPGGDGGFLFLKKKKTIISTHQDTANRHVNVLGLMLAPMTSTGRVPENKL